MRSESIMVVVMLNTKAEEGLIEEFSKGQSGSALPGSLPCELFNVKNSLPKPILRKFCLHIAAGRYALSTQMSDKRNIFSLFQINIMHGNSLYQCNVMPSLTAVKT